MGSSRLKTHVIHHAHNEASALLALHNKALLRAYGWKQAFWVVSDEAPVERAVGALGRCDQGEDWELVHLRGRVARAQRKRTEDAETLARAGSWIYVFGSHFGAKDGPLQPSRHFVARFNEALTARKGHHLEAGMEVARPAFQLHRLLNDAFREFEVPLRRPADVTNGLVQATLERAQQRHKRWRRRLHEDDQPINVEGATFLPNGRLLLGLRYPVGASGAPVLVEVDGIDRAFEGRARAVEVARVWIVDGIGTAEMPSGVRELDQRGSTIHLVTGTLDGDEDRSVVLQALPDTGPQASEHHVIEVPTDQGPVVHLRARRVRRLEGESNVEGLAVLDDGAIWYARDDDEIRLEEAPAGTA